MKTRIILPMLAIVATLAIALGVSAFTGKSPVKQGGDPATAGYFYKYKLSVYDETSIRDINNYQRSNDGCTPGSHVCGVFLPTNASLQSPPDSDEFASVVDELWDSEDLGSAQSPSISMRN